MLPNNHICIFSRAIRTGKTTQLQHWVKDRTGISGILTPDENGMRMLQDIASGKKYALQVNDTFTGPTITIGRFTFDLSVTERAKQILQHACHENPAWLVIDEVGKLEVEQDAGLEPVVTNVIRHYQSGEANGRLLLVVRDSLLNKAIEKYGLQDAAVFSDHLPEL